MGDLVEIQTHAGRPVARYDEFGTVIENAAIDAWKAWLDDRAMIRREIIAERAERRAEVRHRVWMALLVLVALGPLIWATVR
jgi:hypothetical protein